MLKNYELILYKEDRWYLCLPHPDDFVIEWTNIKDCLKRLSEYLLNKSDCKCKQSFRYQIVSELYIPISNVDQYMTEMDFVAPSDTHTVASGRDEVVLSISSAQDIKINATGQTKTALTLARDYDKEPEDLNGRLELVENGLLISNNQIDRLEGPIFTPKLKQQNIAQSNDQGSIKI